uniref:Uncharacterized protein n=1 Tax=Physcomitrium patens TaxID=3218 RepID=A0A2K1IIC3_PHYPA|nr:hypothetical protein PHYPA_027721 [Physcomitrium patens]
MVQMATIESSSASAENQCLCARVSPSTGLCKWRAGEHVTVISTQCRFTKGIAKLKKSWNTTKARADATVHTALWAMAKLMVHSGARKQSQEENDAAEDTKILPFSQPIIKIPLQMHLLHLSLLLFLPPNHIRLEVASFPGKLAFIIFESAIHHNQVVYKK